jgi:hypothetical protein
MLPHRSTAHRASVHAICPRGSDLEVIMYRMFAVTALAIVAACQPARQTDSVPGTSTGSTTSTAGTPTVTRSDTTRTSGGAPTSPNTGGATLSLDASRYAPGARVVMRVTNQTTDTLGYNQCSSRSVERDQGGRWVAHPEPGRMCTMELRLLMPSETQTANTTLPQDLTPGTYRIVLTLGRQRTPPPNSPANWGTVRAISASFRVE